MAYLRCPAQAQARYDEKAYPADTKDSFKGILVHRLIARHFKTGPIEDVMSAAKEEIGQDLNEKMVALGVNRPSLLAPILAEASDLYEKFRRASLDGYRDSEIAVDHPLDPDVRLVGTIDGEFSEEGERTVLRDWKTGPLGEPFDQLLFYAMVWLLSRQKLAAVEAISLATGERARRQPKISDLQVVADRISALVNSTRSVWDGLTAAARTAGPWCSRCPILVSCDEGRAATMFREAGYRAGGESAAFTST
jgi:hypothetical protein